MSGKHNILVQQNRKLDQTAETPGWVNKLRWWASCIQHFR